MGLSVKEELIFALENLGLSDTEISSRISFALNLVHMEDFLDHSPFDLSGGQKQKVAIACALALKPSVLVLDEPTSELDPIGAVEVFTVLSELKKHQNLGLILVSHATEELAAYCDRILLLSEGNQICLKTTYDFFSDLDLLYEFGVQVPQIVELFGEKIASHKTKLPITLPEAVDYFKRQSI
jgi:energy-coupling factor transporter ATP-binding protein EcfA2